MTAKEFLSQAYLLDQRIRSKKDQLAFLRSMATSVYNPMDQEQIDCTPVTYGLENSVMKIIEAEQELEAQIAEMVQTMMEIRRVIASLRDQWMQLVLEKRYLCFLTWKEIAVDLDRSVRWVQEKEKMALEVVERVLEEEERKRSVPGR